MPSSASLFTRHPGNPLLSPERWPYPINAVMNAGATRVGDHTVLVCRAEDRRGFSHLTCARSHDGVSNWVVDEQPALAYDGTTPRRSGVSRTRASRAWTSSTPGSSPTRPSAPAAPASRSPRPPTSTTSSGWGW